MGSGVEIIINHSRLGSCFVLDFGALVRADAAYRRVNNAMMGGLGPDNDEDEDGIIPPPQPEDANVIEKYEKNLAKVSETFSKALGLILGTVGDGPLVQIEHVINDDDLTES